MEKFAVDLDKVLDELEFNEDRAENLLTSSSRRHVTSPLSPEHDDSSLLGASRSSYESGDSENKWRPKPPPVSQKTSVSGVFSSLNEYLNSGRIRGGGDATFMNSLSSQIIPSQDEPGRQHAQLEVDCENISSQAPDYTESHSNDCVTIEEKYDDSDVFRCVQMSSSVEAMASQSKNSCIQQNVQGTLLSDIAPVGTHINLATNEDVNSSLDLSQNNDMSDMGFIDKEKSLILTAAKPVLSFGSLDVDEELDDEALNDYLSDLELEEEQQHRKELKISGDLGCEDTAVAVPRVESHERSGMNTRSSVSEQSTVLVQSEASLSINTTDEVECFQKDHDIKVPSLPNESNTDLPVSLHHSQSQPVSEEKSINAESFVISEAAVCSLLETKENSSALSQKINQSMSELSSVFVEELCRNALHEQKNRVCPETSSSPKDTSQTDEQEYVPGESSCLQDGSEEKNSSGKTENDMDQTVTASTFSACSSESEEVSCTQSMSNNNSESSMEETNSSCLPRKNGEEFTPEYESPESKHGKEIPLSLSIGDDQNIYTRPESPATPPTVPVTPTSQDPPAIDEFVSSLSASSTPFMTPTAVCSESSEFIEGLCHHDATISTSTSEPVVDSEHISDSNASSDVSHKPIRPSSLEIPVCTESALTETAGSSEDSPSACNATIGPPGATPCASRPTMAESVSEPQGTDESATESSVDEGMCAAVGGEPSDVSLLSPEELQLGKEPPFWVPDADAACCMQCDFKFTVLKRRHHCRACGKVLCSKCCSEKAYLEYINAEARVCVSCKSILIKVGETSPASPQRSSMQPNPNNPMEYCSTVPPLLQVAGSSHHQAAPTVMVPVGVLKREGSSKPKSEAKQVMFSDGIRPGADLAELDGSSEPRLSIRRTGRTSKRVGTPPGNASPSQRTLPPVDATTLSYVPHGKGLPPIVIRGKDGIQFEEDPDPVRLMAIMRDDSTHSVKFSVNRNLYVLVKILNLDCCVNRICWCFTSDGLSAVGQDEIVIILEVEAEEATVPKDIFIHLNTLYMEAAKGNTVTEMGHTLTQGSPFLGSKEHGGFLYVRPTFQCLHRLILPPAPYLVGVLIHKWETPWARVFPIRLMLRLGAEFRYYPCPLVSIRHRAAVYGEIGHTIIQVLADFRNMVYTLPTVRGLLIHMEDKQTTILLPRNRYDQVMRALNNSNDHVLAFGANFSQAADSHLVCMQSDTDHSYHTQAINIHNKPRKVTGASFVVFNGALKVSEGMAAKSTIVEDGLMVKVTSETMSSLKTALRDMKDLSITCGPINSSTESANAGAGISPSDEIVLIKWAEDDRSFNIGVLSCVDGRPLDGVPSIRVHNGTDYHGEYRFIRWTEVFILESEEGLGRTGDPVDISRLSEQLAKATCLALVKLLDLLAAANLTTLAVRATIHPENVGYLAGSNGEKLPPIYMNSLDDELVPVLHEAGLMSGESPAVLELVFRIMESG